MKMSEYNNTFVYITRNETESVNQGSNSVQLD